MVKPSRNGIIIGDNLELFATASLNICISFANNLILASSPYNFASGACSFKDSSCSRTKPFHKVLSTIIRASFEFNCLLLLSLFKFFI